MKFWIILSILLPVVLALGCSGAVVNPANPTDDTREATEGDGGAICLGTWQVVYDIATGDMNATPLREGGYAVNVLGLMEPPPLQNVTVDFGTLNFHNPFLDVDVILIHPIPDTTFTGFDVRGIVFGPELLNADGYTDFMSPEYFEGVQFGYINGLLGVPNSTAGYNDGRWGYKYFANGLGLNDDLVEFFSNEDNLVNRGHFANGAQRVRHYELSWENTEPPIDFMVFNYAVYANYDWPTGEFPYDIDDFSISTANCAEPFCMDYTITENGLYYYMGEGGGGSEPRYRAMGLAGICWCSSYIV